MEVLVGARGDAFLMRDVANQDTAVQQAQAKVADDHADAAFWEGVWGTVIGAVGAVIGFTVGGIPGAMAGWSLGQTTGELTHDYVIDPLVGHDAGESTLGTYYDVGDAKFYQSDLWEVEQQYEDLIAADQTSDVIDVGKTLLDVGTFVATDAVKNGSDSVLAKYMPSVYDSEWLNIDRWHNVYLEKTADLSFDKIDIDNIVSDTYDSRIDETSMEILNLEEDG